MAALLLLPGFSAEAAADAAAAAAACSFFSSRSRFDLALDSCFDFLCGDARALCFRKTGPLDSEKKPGENGHADQKKTSALISKNFDLQC